MPWVDVFNRDHEPAAAIAPGDSFTVETLDAAGHLEPQTTPGEVRPLALPGRRGHCLPLPYAVTGAQAGDVLGVHLDELTPGDWGWTATGGKDSALNRHLGEVEGDPSWLLWEIGAHHATEQHGLRVPVRPFLGITGLAPAEPGEHPTVPPRADTGGNIDCRELVAGSTLYLPVQVAGALLYLGDGHAAQGDGEAGGTAVETSMTTRLHVTLNDADLDTVHAVTPAGRITFGFSPDLNEATAQALEAMIRWLGILFGLPRREALAVAGVAVDLRVTQVANTTWGVHAVLSDDRLARA